jgi:hypothetical protein
MKDSNQRDLEKNSIRSTLRFPVPISVEGTSLWGTKREARMRCTTKRAVGGYPLPQPGPKRTRGANRKAFLIPLSGR